MSAPELEAEHKANAIAAAHCAAKAAEELLRYAREGAASENFAFNFMAEPLEQLADALKMAISIERPLRQAAGDDAEGVELLGQLDHTLMIFLEGWA